MLIIKIELSKMPWLAISQNSLLNYQPKFVIANKEIFRSKLLRNISIINVLFSIVLNNNVRDFRTIKEVQSL